MVDGFYVDSAVVSQTRTETSFPMVAGHIDSPGEVRQIHRKIGPEHECIIRRTNQCIVPFRSSTVDTWQILIYGARL